MLTSSIGAFARHEGHGGIAMALALTGEAATKGTKVVRERNKGAGPCRRHECYSIRLVYSKVRRTHAPSRQMKTLAIAAATAIALAPISTAAAGGHTVALPAPFCGRTAP